MVAIMCHCGGTLRYRCEDHVERHGLDCGPYERWTEQWYICGSCGERFTDRELAEMAKEEEAKYAALESQVEDPATARRA